MEHLSLEVFDLATKDNPNPTGSRYAALPEDTSITITDTSDIFASGDVWSHPFTLNVAANAHIFGTAGDMHGGRLHEQIDKRRARLWVEGLPFYFGCLRLGDEAEVDADGNVDVTFESGQKTFEELIEGAKANQVPMMGDVLIGMALWRKRWTKFQVKLQASAPINNSVVLSGPVMSAGRDVFEFEYDGEMDGSSVQEYPRMVFPRGEFRDEGAGYAESFDCINADTPYDEAHPYCNVALCYQRYGYERKDDNGNISTDYSSEPEAQRGYEYMPADRVNSAPNFYVIYWVRALMKHLGIQIDENQMMDVQDMRRLFFVNTRCEYEEPKKLRSVSYNSRYGRYRWGGSGRLVPEWIFPQKNVSIDESGFAGKNARVVDQSFSGEWTVKDRVSVKISGIMEWGQEQKETYKTRNGYFHKAYATSDCFPDVDVSDVIGALKNGFGVRLLFSDNYTRVRIVLLRSILNDRTVQDVSCEILGRPSKTENAIRGFRMTYGESEDTHFYYKGFADMLPRRKELWIDNTDKHDYSHWDLKAVYENLINRVSAFDKTCYVVEGTGNAYGIKVDKDAKRYDQLHPSLFEYAGFMDAEDGDCTGEDDTIETVDAGFTPAIMNDLNMEEERKGSLRQRFALFVDETMRVRRPPLNDGTDYNDSDAVYNPDRLYREDTPYASMMAEGVVKPGEFAALSDMYASKAGCTAHVEKSFGPLVFEADIAFDLDGHIFEGYRLYLQDNYEPNDKGVCPIEDHDWGLMLGIMRGSGSDMHVNYSVDPDDGEGNDTWDIVSGSSITAHPDTCDDYGNEWDYNGSSATARTPAQIEAEYWNRFSAGAVPFSNASRGYITSAVIMGICATETDGRLATHQCLVVSSWSTGASGCGSDAWWRTVNGHHIGEIWNNQLVIKVDATEADLTYLQDLIAAYEDAINSGGSAVSDNGIGSRQGRFSLKLRAEKPNPYFKASWCSTGVETKADAGEAMKAVYYTANTDLLGRPKVARSTVRAAGWNCPGDGYTTAYGVTYSVDLSDGKEHLILFTPIRENGSVIGPVELYDYFRSNLEGHAAGELPSLDTQHLLLDIDTTGQRASVLQQLQDVYYGMSAGPVVLHDDMRYLHVGDANLRGRGLMDQFYKEYSYWVRNARVVPLKVRMEMSELLTIDKTKRVRVGDFTGFIRKMQYQVSSSKGLGIVTMEIMYI